MCEAIPDLKRLARYERRAWSRLFVIERLRDATAMALAKGDDLDGSTFTPLVCGLQIPGLSLKPSIGEVACNACRRKKRLN